LAELERFEQSLKDDLEDVDEIVSEREAQIEEAQYKDMDYGSPSPERKDTPITFFLKILGIKDATRSGYLQKDEIGMLPIFVRDYQDIAAYNRAEGCDIVAKYLDHKSQIVLGTSLSRDGFFLKTAVTQIKMETKTRKWDESKKQGWFSKLKGNSGGESE
jgi:hypothetical protein